MFLSFEQTAKACLRIIFTFFPIVTERTPLLSRNARASIPTTLYVFFLCLIEAGMIMFFFPLVQTRAAVFFFSLTILYSTFLIKKVL